MSWPYTIAIGLSQFGMWFGRAISDGKITASEGFELFVMIAQTCGLRLEWDLPGAPPDAVQQGPVGWSVQTPAPRPEHVASGGAGEVMADPGAPRGPPRQPWEPAGSGYQPRVICTQREPNAPPRDP